MAKHRISDKTRKQEVNYLLEAGTLNDMRAAKQKTAGLLKYYWNFYAELAHQRNQIQDEIKNVLIQKSEPFEFKKWQRAVKYKYGLHPLSTVGNISNIGGRFNTGVGINSGIPSFAGLYLAEDKDTALQEHLGQETTHPSSELSARDLALTSPASETIVSVSGKLDKIFNLTNINVLGSFIKLIKKFSLSKELVALAKKLGQQRPTTIKPEKELLDTLLCKQWRIWPTQFDVPSNSQIFGHLIYLAGIEGIKYPSKFTKKACVIIFPKNFYATDSFIEIDDEPPHPDVPIRIDASNWRISELSAKEIINIHPTIN